MFKKKKKKPNTQAKPLTNTNMIIWISPEEQGDPGSFGVHNLPLYHLVS